jgi:uncharacterized protein
MSNALRDQLLKSGLVNDKQVKQAAKEKRKENNNQQQGKSRLSDAEAAKRQIQQAQAEKAERDRLLNLQRKEAAEQKAVTAQIKQLVEAHRLDKGDGEIAFNFTDGTTVKRIYVGDKVRGQIAQGRLAIVKVESQYELVAADIAEKVRARHAASVVLWNAPDARAAVEAPGDDPYANFQVPDDLMW